MGPFSLFTAASLGTGGSALNVAAGGYPSHNASVRHLQAAAGSGVIVIGARTLLQR